MDCPFCGSYNVVELALDYFLCKGCDTEWDEEEFEDL